MRKFAVAFLREGVTKSPAISKNLDSFISHHAVYKL